MLTKMSSPVFKIQGKERPPIEFKEGLNVVLGKDDGAMSIGKSSHLRYLQSILCLVAIPI